MQNKSDIEILAAKIKWFHQIRLNKNFLTAGLDRSEEKCANLFIPANLKNKSVIDLGCWDGFFSFECEKRGANVTSVDDFVWRNWETKDRGYDLAHAVLKSKAVKVQCPFEKLHQLTARKFFCQLKTPTKLVYKLPEKGYDIVLMLGVLYHAPDPLGYLRAARKICKDMLILETHVDLLDCARPAIAYYEGDSLNGDATNFWGPNTAAVIGMLKDAGFKKIDPQPIFWSSRQAFHAYI
jgi:tRNA (mo5U34)-methyltransferase